MFAYNEINMMKTFSEFLRFRQTLTKNYFFLNCQMNYDGRHNYVLVKM
jgi:hypothetical protein